MSRCKTALTTRVLTLEHSIRTLLLPQVLLFAPVMFFVRVNLIQ